MTAKTRANLKLNPATGTTFADSQQLPASQFIDMADSFLTFDDDAGAALSTLKTKDKTLVASINEAMGWTQCGYFVRGDVTWNPTTKILSFANRAYIIHGYTGGATYTVFQTSSVSAPFTIDFSGVTTNSYAFAYVTNATQTTTQQINSSNIVIGDWSSIAASMRSGGVFVLAAFTNHTKQMVHSPFILAQMETNSLLELDSTRIGGNNYEIVAGVLRESGGTWDFITTSNHTFRPSTATVTQTNGSSGYITLNYGKTYSNVIAFVATPDDTYAAAGLVVGSSVGLSDADIYLRRPSRVHGRIYYDGADWQYDNGENISGVSYNSGTGKLTITHGDCGTRKQIAVTGAGVYLPVVDAVAATATDVFFRDLANNGAIITGSETTDMDLWLWREGLPLVDPSTTQPAGSNIWCMGIFEI